MWGTATSRVIPTATATSADHAGARSGTSSGGGCRPGPPRRAAAAGRAGTRQPGTGRRGGRARGHRINLPTRPAPAGRDTPRGSLGARGPPRRPPAARAGRPVRAGASPSSPRPSAGRSTPTPTALCIVAGAGSGKTRVLTLRVARRIRDGSAGGRPHRRVHLHPQGRPRAARPARPLRGARLDPGAARAGSPRPGCGPAPSTSSRLTLLRRRAADTGRPPPALVEHRWRTLAELAGDRTVASVADTEIGWAKARCLDPGRLRGRGRRRPGAGRCRSTGWPRSYAGYQDRLARRGLLDLDDVLLQAGRPPAATTPASPSRPAGATGTWPSTSSRT